MDPKIAVILLMTFVDRAVAGGEICYASYASSWYVYTVYCEDGCCGYYYSRECCSIGPAIAAIVGGLVGGGLFIFSCIVVICIIVKCNKKQTGVVMAGRQQAGGQVTVVNAGQTGQHYGQPAFGQPMGGYGQQAYGQQYPPPQAAFPPPPAY